MFKNILRIPKLIGFYILAAIGFLLIGLKWLYYANLVFLLYGGIFHNHQLLLYFAGYVVIGLVCRFFFVALPNASYGDSSSSGGGYFPNGSGREGVDVIGNAGHVD